MLDKVELRQWGSLVVVLLGVFLGLGCGVPSDHPLGPVEGSDPIPEYLVGGWDYIEIAGVDARTKGGGLVLDRKTDGSLEIAVTENEATSELTASFSVVGNLQILSVRPQEAEDAWVLALINYSEERQELSVSFLGQVEVVRDIRLGLVEGEVYQFDRENLARLTASPGQLREYLSAHEGAFSDRVLKLKKRTP
jgi:hypothetical protein